MEGIKRLVRGRSEADRPHAALEPGHLHRLFDHVRKLFAATKAGPRPGLRRRTILVQRREGPCENCEGEGFVMVELLFLPSVYAPCPACHGARYNAKTLEIRYRDKNIADVLGLTVDDAWEFFADEPHVHRALDVLREVGLGYLRLGQPATELSGGEAQRIKLAAELQRIQRGTTLYVLDEPTTGLHPADVERLMAQLDGLVEAGNTVIVVEHECGSSRAATGSSTSAPAPARKAAASWPPEPRPWLPARPASPTAPYLARFLGTPGQESAEGDLAQASGQLAMAEREVAGSAAPFIEDDQPPAIPLPPPDRAEGSHLLTFGVEYRAAAQGERARRQHLDHIRLPGEGRVWLLEEPAPAPEHGRFPSHNGGIAKENGLRRHVRAESLEFCSAMLVGKLLSAAKTCCFRVEAGAWGRRGLARPRPARITGTIERCIGAIREGVRSLR